MSPVARLIVAAVAVIAVAASAPIAEARQGAPWTHECPGTGAVPAASKPPRSSAREVRCLINAWRRSQGLSRVQPNRKLATAARSHARDMVRRTYFSHVSPEGEDHLARVRQTDYLDGAGSWWLGENLAWGAEHRASPLATVRAWLRSPAHRRVLASDKASEIGIGVARGAPVAADFSVARTYAAEFGGRD